MNKYGEKLVLLLMLATTAVVNGADLSALLKDREIFKTDSRAFIAKYAGGKFKWNDRDKTEMVSRQPGSSLKLFGMPTCNTIIRLKDNKVSAIDISIYNRGDAKLISQPDFYKILAEVKQQLNVAYDVKGTGNPYKRLAGSKIFSMTWKTPEQTAMLEWSTSGRLRSEFKAEFIRLKITASGTTAAGPQLRSGIKSSEELIKRLQRKPDGSIYLELPMVDQGQKAYCAASSVERVLRYYGSDVSQHLIAELFGTSSAAGSSPEKLLEALKKADVKLGVKVQTYDCGFEMNSYSQFRKFLREYNKAARKLKDRQISENDIKRNPRIIFNMMRSPAFVYMRKKNRGDFNKFQRAIHSNINEGIPVFWGMIYGLMKEQKQVPGIGGHLRVITGYNDRKKEIIYTDTWGAGHEFKSMKIENAWAVTIGIFTLKPRTKR